jgi:copper chaperone CopZ
MPEFTLRIENMHCGSCVRRVTEALAATDGIEVQEVRIGAARVRAIKNPPPIDLVVAALGKSGYPAVVMEQ